MTFNFHSCGLDYGNYEGRDKAEAQDAFASSAGYQSWSAMAEQAEEFGGNNVEVVEVVEV